MVMTAAEFRTWMDERGYSIRAMARELEISPTTVQRYRRGDSPVPKPIELALKLLEQER